MKCDVVVVGAGPAGSTAAKCLAEKGFQVVLIDKERFPRVKPCGGGVPMITFKRFPYLQNSKFIDSYSYGGIIYSPSLKYKIELHAEKPLVAMVLREIFDQGLASVARDHGVQFQDGKKVRDVRFLADKVEVSLQGGASLTCAVVVGADGVTGFITRRAGLAPIHKKVNVCVFQEYQLGEQVIDEYFSKERPCHLHLMYRNIPGYAWLFPKRNCVNIGVGEFVPYRKHAPRKFSLIDTYRIYFKSLQQEKLIPSDLDMGRVRGGCVPISPIPRTYGERVLLCGDAAGFINPVSGGGIYFAMVSGENAAMALREAFENECFTSSFLSRYQRMWMEEFGMDLKTLARFTPLWLRHTERFMKIASKDHRLIDIAAAFVFGDIQIRDYRGRVFTYYFQDRVKELLGIL